MSLVLNVSENKLRDIIKSKFEFLLRLFDFDPNRIPPHKIEVAVVCSIKEFLEIYKKEYLYTPPKYVVGFAASNGRIFILHKELFEKRGHSKDEFEKVIAHELCHIFVRRILEPKSTFRWIEEGLCQYIAFKGQEFKVINFVNFRELETKEDWKKYRAYQQSAKFFEFLDEKFGMKKIINFVKLVKFKKEYDAFKEVFGNFESIQGKFLKSLDIENEN